MEKFVILIVVRILGGNPTFNHFSSFLIMLRFLMR